MTGVTSPPLVASAVRLDGPGDVFDAVTSARSSAWITPGTVLSGRGEATRVHVPAGQRHRAADLVAEALGAIELDLPPGAPGPAAFGALPFDPAVAASLVVPAVQLRRDGDGARWLLRIHPAGTDPDAGRDGVGIADGEGPSDGPPARPPERFSITPRTSHDGHVAAVRRAVAEIRSGRLAKVVLARAVDIEADRPFDLAATLRRLRASYASCYLYAVDGFVGASPELLVARSGDVVRAQPMAGTTQRLGDPVVDAQLAARLLASAKDLHEHRVTIDSVHDALLPWCSYLDAEPEPHVVAISNVQHLATTVEGRLSRPLPSVLQLVTALHPTPAVGGQPTAAALELIAELEPGGRGRYAGPVGWVDADGNGEWAVGVRGAEIDGHRATLYAGGGIVADSDAEAELAETQAKLSAMLTALVRP